MQLQIQLVTRKANSEAGVLSPGRARAESVGSTRSYSTFASDGSGGDRKKARLIPLYNLQRHSLLPSAVTDAANDDKVALFRKKTLDIVNIASLEVFAGQDNIRTNPKTSFLKAFKKNTEQSTLGLTPCGDDESSGRYTWVATRYERSAIPTPLVNFTWTQAGQEQETDKEDSEAVWTCTLHYGPHQVRLGTLTPTPHHPKVVAKIHVPQSLSDVVLVEGEPESEAGAEAEATTPIIAEDRNRTVSQGTVQALPQRNISQRTVMAKNMAGDVLDQARKAVDAVGSAIFSSFKDPTGVPSLSAEELKDILCCTALWLVVRECIGGVTDR